VEIAYAVDGVAMPRFDRRRVREVVGAAVKRKGGITVLFVSDARAIELHGAHFGDPTTTDVMTFPDGGVDPGTGAVHLGDLAVCVPVARREARLRKRPMADELALYILHGVLHLLGHDDRDDRSRRAMWAVQRRLLARIGIAIEAQP
jgi:probable rRNA maturation factor